MRCSNVTTSALALVIGGLLTLGMLSEPALAGTQHESLRQGLPGRRISGGSRSPRPACLNTLPSQPVIALIPENNIGLTLSAHPTFWFSLPAVSAGKSLEFGIFDQAGEMVYQQTFEASEEAGISHLSLPETAAPLEVDQDYRWYLSVVCNPDSRSEDLFVTGWVKRVRPNRDISQQLVTATDQERLALYEKSALWYDMLTALAELRRNNPADTELTQRWSMLLKSVNLAQAIAVPSGRPVSDEIL